MGEYPVEDQRLVAHEVPTLGPVVIHTPSCDSFLPWTENSIALAFADQGAAAYLGQVYSPISSGYFIGRLDALPGYNTWPGLPMGVLVHIQNRASMRAFASTPFLFMLGDPRIAMQVEAPYTITSDTEKGNRRVIQGNWESAATSPGVLPLRIPGGAAYRFIRVKGVGAVADNDLFYHQAIQTLDVQGDKVALILHSDGAFEIELRKTVPPLWHQVDALRDAFEFVWCSTAMLQSLVALVPLGLLLVVGVVKIIRKKSLRPYLPALYVGWGWATLQLVFCLFRLDGVSVSSNPIHPTAVDLGLAFVGTFAVVTLGLVRMFDARKPSGKVLGLVVCLAPTLFLLGVYGGAVTFFNFVMAQESAEGVWPLNYIPVRLTAMVGIIEMLVFLKGYWLLRRLAK